ncbi:hypothetical protein [Ideonella livida]|uniref:Uncharacterized protein n=1 Tax=Ideonella livida TaxID=2707176 RepID=A0A7C9PIW7_9BURK|nr:hypothetical protein [Ideonella livida]NDY93155.1 hypothetical protein [Ideonella livida]
MTGLRRVPWGLALLALAGLCGGCAQGPTAALSAPPAGLTLLLAPVPQPVPADPTVCLRWAEPGAGTALEARALAAVAVELEGMGRPPRSRDCGLTVLLGTPQAVFDGGGAPLDLRPALAAFEPPGPWAADARIRDPLQAQPPALSHADLAPVRRVLRAGAPKVTMGVVQNGIGGLKTPGRATPPAPATANLPVGPTRLRWSLTWQDPHGRRLRTDTAEVVLTSPAAGWDQAWMLLWAALLRPQGGLAPLQAAQVQAANLP